MAGVISASISVRHFALVNKQSKKIYEAGHRCNCIFLLPAKVSTTNGNKNGIFLNAHATPGSGGGGGTPQSCFTAVCRCRGPGVSKNSKEEYETLRTVVYEMVQR